MKKPGGRRPGAGRKSKLGRASRLTVQLDSSLLARLDRAIRLDPDRPSRGGYLRVALRNQLDSGDQIRLPARGGACRTIGVLLPEDLRRRADAAVATGQAPSLASLVRASGAARADSALGPELGTPPDLFAILAEEWRTQRPPHFSSRACLTSHPAYQRIIAIGPAAIPLILRELQREPDHWFWALQILTGDDPVRPRDRGDIEASARAWIEWGRRKGYLP